MLVRRGSGETHTDRRASGRDIFRNTDTSVALGALRVISSSGLSTDEKCRSLFMDDVKICISLHLVMVLVGGEWDTGG